MSKSRTFPEQECRASPLRGPWRAYTPLTRAAHSCCQPRREPLAAAVRSVSAATVRRHGLCAHFSDLLPQACPFAWTHLPPAHPMFASKCSFVPAYPRSSSYFQKRRSRVSSDLLSFSTDAVPEAPGFTSPEKEAAVPPGCSRTSAVGTVRDWAQWGLLYTWLGVTAVRENSHLPMLPLPALHPI